MVRYPLVLLLVLAQVSCQNREKALKTVMKLPKELQECSGITAFKGMLWGIADSGNTNAIYGLDNEGNISDSKNLDPIQNIDWEDLTCDRQGNLYIGDFGNNKNERTDLAIYKVAVNELQNKNIKVTTKISFAYPEQKEFPPQKKSLLYDCEAFFELDGFFYLFTKNRSKGFDGTTLIYKIPNKEGYHAAQLIGQYKTGTAFNDSAITGAAISPNGSQFVLLSHRKIWLFENFRKDDFLKGTISVLELNHYSQKEAVCFKDNNTLLIADEKNKKNGGNIYEVSLKDLKAKP